MLKAYPSGHEKMHFESNLICFSVQFLLFIVANVNEFNAGHVTTMKQYRNTIYYKSKCKTVCVLQIPDIILDGTESTNN